MELDKSELHDGLKLICGKWQVEFVVNAFSNDLARIPAKEFKSDDGKDFSDMTFEFFEDHTVLLHNGVEGKDEKGTWEQTGFIEFRYTLGAFMDIPEGVFRDNAEKLMMVDGFLCFSIGFLSVGMKKIEEGHVTEEPSINDIEPSEEDKNDMTLVGTYAVKKSFAMIDDKIGAFTREEIEANLKKQLAAGEIEEDEIAEGLQVFESRFEFTEDHKLNTLFKLPEGISKEEIDAALEGGDIIALRGEYAVIEQTEWKTLGGKYYYDTHREREIDGVTTTYCEMKLTDDGLSYAEGMIVLEKI